MDSSASIFDPGALELCPGEGEARQRYKIAFRMAEGNFRSSLLKEQQFHFRKLMNDRLKGVNDTDKLAQDEREKSAFTRIEEEAYDIETIRESEYLAVVDGTVDVNTWAREMEKKIEDLRQKAYKEDQELEKAKKAVRALTLDDRDATRALTGREAGMKKAVLDVARQLNPRAAEAAEVLGRFYMRTPAFFYQLMLIEWNPADMQDSSENDNITKQRMAGVLPRLPSEFVTLPSQASQAFRVYEAIDSRARHAAHQDDNAICELLAVMASDCTESHEHLIRVILELSANVQRIDQAHMDEKGAKCAMVANWPDHSTGTVPKPYTQMTRDIRKLIGSHSVGRQLSSKLCNAFVRNAQAGKEPSPEDKLLSIKQVVEQNFLEHMAKDPLMHITGQVAEVLITIANRGLNELRTELFHLYGSEDVFSQLEKEQCAQQKHWFERRQAAARVCEIAMHGNEIALNCVCKHLLKETHWMILQVAVTETARIIGKLPEDHPRKRELVDVLIRGCFDHPDIDSNSAAPTEVELRETQNVQLAIEAGLIKELPHYGVKTQEYCIALFKQAAEWFPPTGRIKKDRIMKELESTMPTLHASSGTPVKPGRAAGYSGDQTLRKARQQMQLKGMH